MPRIAGGRGPRRRCGVPDHHRRLHRRARLGAVARSRSARRSPSRRRSSPSSTRRSSTRSSRGSRPRMAEVRIALLGDDRGHRSHLELNALRPRLLSELGAEATWVRPLRRRPTRHRLHGSRASVRVVGPPRRQRRGIRRRGARRRPCRRSGVDRSDDRPWRVVRAATRSRLARRRRRARAALRSGESTLEPPPRPVCRRRSQDSPRCAAAPGWRK